MRELTANNELLTAEETEEYEKQVHLYGSPYVRFGFAGKFFLFDRQYRVCRSCKLYCWCGSALVGCFVADHSECVWAYEGRVTGITGDVKGTVYRAQPVADSLTYRAAYSDLEELASALGEPCL